MTAVEVSYGTAHTQRFEGNNHHEFDEVIRQDLARLLADRNMPKAICSCAHDRYVLAICEFTANLAHGKYSRLEVLEYGDGSIEFIGVDTLADQDLRPRDWDVDLWWGSVGTGLIEEIVGPGNYEVHVEGRLHHSRMLVSPEYVLSHVA